MSIIVITPQDFLRDHCKAFDCADHHHTGPANAQQDEGNGSVFHEEGRILAGLAKRLGGPVLELGADLGISSRYIAEGLMEFEDNNPKGTLTAERHLLSVDIYHKWVTNRPNHTQLHQDSGIFDAKGIDYVWSFIDGDHRYRGVIRDIGAATRAMGTFRALFHDTSPDMPRAVHQSEGSDARLAVLDVFGNDPFFTVFDITSHCGLMWVIETL